MTLQHPEVVMYIIQGAWAIADINNTNDKKPLTFTKLFIVVL